MFVDSDDYAEPECCETACRLAETYQADVVFLGYRCIKPDTVIVHHFPYEDGELTTKQAIDCIIDNNTVAWNKLYRKELFENIRFPVGHVYEDVGTVYKVILKAHKIYLNSAILYNYMQDNINSISHQLKAQNQNDLFFMVMQRLKDLEAWGYALDYREVRAREAMNYLIKLGSYNKYSNECKEILNAQKNNLRYFRFSTKIAYLLYRGCPPLFEWICKASNKRIYQ